MIRDRKTLFRERAGRIENVYTLKVLNMNQRPHRYELHAERIPGLDRCLDGPIEAEAGAVVEVPVPLMAEESRLKSRSTPVTFALIAADDDRLSVREDAASSARRHEPASISSQSEHPLVPGALRLAPDLDPGRRRAGGSHHPGARDRVGRRPPPTVRRRKAPRHQTRHCHIL